MEAAGVHLIVQGLKVTLIQQLQKRIYHPAFNGHGAGQCIVALCFEAESGDAKGKDNIVCVMVCITSFSVRRLSLLVMCIHQGMGNL